MRILLTRPEADARKSAEALAARGHHALIAPLFEIVATGIQKPNGQFTALLATSTHAFDGEITAPIRLPLNVVGERTAEAAKRNGFTLAHVASDGETLARRIGPGGEHFLYFAGRERRPELEANLTENGHAVTPWIVYETRNATELPECARRVLVSGEIDAVLHFSTRSAALYRSLARQAGLEAEALKPAQIAISTRAGRELEGAGLMAIAPTADLAGLISALEALS